jgi:hypothetical protein
MASPEIIIGLPDKHEGLARRFRKAVRGCTSNPELAGGLPKKRCTATSWNCPRPSNNWCLGHESLGECSQKVSIIISRSEWFLSQVWVESLAPGPNDCFWTSPHLEIAAKQSSFLNALRRVHCLCTTFGQCFIWQRLCVLPLRKICSCLTFIHL